MLQKFFGMAALLTAVVSYSGPVRAGGGEIPTPLDVGPGKMELADGEKYNLYGRIVTTTAGVVYFEVDLNLHRALANQKRVRFPYYPIADGYQFDLSRFKNKLVKIYVEAKMQVLMSTEGETSPVIFLKLLSEPLLQTPTHEI
ncbi:hypothetical protein K2X30_00240 [bacterium]|jgi:hypothetical protein|nr:hypothetical protein [bacterium]